jgi:hypothetical protein
MPVTGYEPLSTQVQGQESGHRTYTSVFRVYTDTVYDGASTVMIYGGLPQLGDPYLWGNSFDYGARLNALPVVRLERDDQNARKIWIATCTYTTRGRQLEQQPPDDPLTWPWKVSGDADEWTEEAAEDVDGEPLMNSAFQQLRGKQVERFRTRRKWVLTKNFATVNQTMIDYFEGSVNRSTITILGAVYPPETLYMRRITFTREWYAYNTPYFPHTFNIDCNPEGFRRKIIDKGTMQVIPGTGNVFDPADMTAITDPVTEDQIERYLDGAASPLAAGEPSVILNAPHGFKLYDDEEWNIIGFPP